MSGVAAPFLSGFDEVVREFGTDVATGLSSKDVARRLAESGPNELVSEPPRAAWLRFVAQFANTLTVVLALAAAVTGVIGDLKDTIVIGAILLINAVVGYLQEGKAERAVEALRKMTADHCRVRREGSPRLVSSSELVPGDVVLLEAGEIVPADLRLVEAQALFIQEAALTGEAEPVAKSVEPVERSAGALLADQYCMAFKSTPVTHGRGVGVVTATGMSTEIGRVAELVQGHRRTLTPLQARLAMVGRWLAVGALVVCAVVFTAGVARGEPVDKMFLTAVSLAVAAIPEGLPAVVTVALALGARRMAERHAIVRRLPAVEALGSVTVICTDKTGTLTANEMVVERAWTPNGAYTVSGDGYAPDGEVVAVELLHATPGNGRSRTPGEDGPLAAATGDPLLVEAAEVATACNDASLHPPPGPRQPWRLVGDPTEGALLAFAGKLGVDQAELARSRPRRAELAFDPGRRRMATIHTDGKETWVAVKGALGALEPLLAASQAGALARASAVADEWAAAGLRVLALAERRRAGLPEPLEGAEQDLLLVGLVGITDPPRPDAIEAIAHCQKAGISPVMITGDHPLTATAIARRIGITDDSGGVLTGDVLERLDETELAGEVTRTSVYARTTPEQKLRIVEAWKSSGAIVAMTGDGVNDAPALRLADIGVAMGVTGTDVSKEAADMVLADDNFASIVHAVEEGRRIYDNIRRFVRYLLTTNSAEIWVMFLAPLIGLPLPLLPIQILWINLVTDGPPAIALGLEPAEPDVLERPPRPAEESVLGGGLWQSALWMGCVMAGVTIGVQAGARASGWHWQTMVFTTLALLQLGNALAVRSEHESTLRLGWRRNPWLVVAVAGAAFVQLCLVYLPFLHGIFRTSTLGPTELGVVLVASTVGFLVPEVAKWIVRRRETGGTR